MLVKKENALSGIQQGEAIEAKESLTDSKFLSAMKLFLKKEKAIIVSMVMFLVLFTLVIANISYFLQNDSYEVICNSYNSARSSALAKQNVRGNIYASGGEILAYSQTLEDATEYRIYPYKAEFAHVVGFNTNGRMGIESMANMSLQKSNVSLRQKIESDMMGEKNAGDNVYTTLDVKLQLVAYEALGKNDGAVIAMNPQNGQILAMVSKPDFDPQTIDMVWDNVINDKDSSVLVNRATQGVYPPGSVFKIVDVIEYLREHNNSIDGYTYECEGVETFGDSQISCYHQTVHGTVDFKTAFAKSCNCAFANMGSTFNKPIFEGTLKEVLFNIELPLNIAYSKSDAEMCEDTIQSDLLQTVIGQGTMQMTPIHVAMITSAIAHNGELMIPYMIQQVENAQEKVVHSYSPQSYGEIMTNQEAAILKELMSAAVSEGTASVFKDADYTAAGKTGSAEYHTDKSRSHAWYTGFAPVDNPQIVVTVIVEDGGSGGNVAAPIAKQVTDAYFEK